MKYKANKYRLELQLMSNFINNWSPGMPWWSLGWLQHPCFKSGNVNPHFCLPCFLSCLYCQHSREGTKSLPENLKQCPNIVKMPFTASLTPRWHLHIAWFCGATLYNTKTLNLHKYKKQQLLTFERLNVFFAWWMKRLIND